jgi:hypothetical protein
MIKTPRQLGHFIFIIIIRHIIFKILKILRPTFGNGNFMIKKLPKIPGHFYECDLNGLKYILYL